MDETINREHLVGLSCKASERKLKCMKNSLVKVQSEDICGLVASGVIYTRNEIHEA